MRPEVHLSGNDEAEVMVMCHRPQCAVTDVHTGRTYPWCGDLPEWPTVEQAADAVAAHLATHDRPTDHATTCALLVRHAECDCPFGRKP